MRVTNQGPQPEEPHGPFKEWMKIQGEFQARLAEETTRYLRRLQGAMAPAAPGTVVQRTDTAMELSAAGPPGGRAQLRFEVHNLQRMHCMLTPQLTPLVSQAGVTWFPAAADATRLLAPEQVQEIVIDVPVPAELVEGTYRGALLLQGFGDGALPVGISVASAP
jgi:hypothetical protein